MFSRRDFFGWFGRIAENPQVWREKRVAELRALALETAPLEWDADQREETARAIEQKLSYLSDHVLRQENMRKYVENIVRTKEMFYAAQRAEQAYLRRQEADSHYESNEETHD